MSWGIDTLESKRLLSASLSNGVLTVVGTAGDNRITVTVGAVVPVPTTEQKRYSVSVDGELSEFAFQEVHKIIIRAGAGNDVVDLDYYTYAVDAIYSEPISIPAVVRGEAGNDQLYSGSRRTILRGNAGNDLLEADRASHGVFEQGGAGRDTLIGSLGDDSLFGGSGLDIISCLGGNDHAYGNSGDDSIDGGEGDDFIFGGSGRNTLDGGSGDDVVTNDGTPA